MQIKQFRFSLYTSCLSSLIQECRLVFTNLAVLLFHSLFPSSEKNFGGTLDLRGAQVEFRTGHRLCAIEFSSTLVRCNPARKPARSKPITAVGSVTVVLLWSSFFYKCVKHSEKGWYVLIEHNLASLLLCSTIIRVKLSRRVSLALNTIQWIVYYTVEILVPLVGKLSFQVWRDF